MTERREGIVSMNRLTDGDTVKVTGGSHPWFGERGTLVAFEEYGLGWKGWRVALDNGAECYASTLQLQRIGK
jgi:hypothetical protein